MFSLTSTATFCALQGTLFWARLVTPKKKTMPNHAELQFSSELKGLTRTLMYDDDDDIDDAYKICIHQCCKQSEQFLNKPKKPTPAEQKNTFKSCLLKCFS